jgi:dihydrofolate reductase
MKTVLIAALTIDGFIGRDASHLADWTGDADKKLFKEVTSELGVMVMGSRTALTIGRALPGRRTIVYTHHPEAIPFDGIETTAEAPTDLVRRLETEGVGGLAVCGGASIYGQFMAAGIVDELYITYAPKLFGTGVTLSSQTLDINLELLETRQLNADTFMLRYRVVR